MAKKRSDDGIGAGPPVPGGPGSSTAPPRAPRRFESAVDEIEQIVQRLESGQLDLGESLQQYARGIETLQECHRLLEDAERRVTLLSGFDADGNPVTTPIDQAQLGLDSAAGQTARGREFFGKSAIADPDGELSGS